MSSFDFSGKRALVIGGSRGIGKGVTQELVLQGAETFYAARKSSIDEKNANFIQVDVNNENEIIDLFQKIDKFGEIDIVVNTAAINFCKKFDEISVDEWDKVERVNLRASFIICQQASIRMKKQKHGKIVNISSIAGRHRSLVSGVHYVSTKAGIIGLTKQFAYELGPSNVNVNVVCPSQTMSDMLSDSMTSKEIKNLSSNIPLRRIATIDEQVGPILFLCSDLSSYMTGAVIDVNGGQI
jgi:NAD(P)-dependent dehydrogenase (short-subunit alcohol dehydrogenase family)